ncbi:S9 family peptidase [Pseudonocardia sp. HH130630-07]|uniref:S9 family peptidase n=1 Tax=Pseudonocardia sp. HH130630-07 TaxID=1690815 RepID=UPI0008153346|nr:DPP IV N-terminal domain-containing protein [Pseudonocardia sp. HH130630-07]ANY08480.1 peptidase S9 [Pseudonocardia sp. HH130630-07]
MTQLTDADYARAEQMLAPYRARRIPGGVVAPAWLSDGARFRYRSGARYVVVDPAAGTRHDAFDHDRLAAALSRESGTAVEGTDLKLTALDLEPSGADGETDAIRFTALDQRWEWSDRSGTCTRVDDDRVAPGESVSPDGQWVAFGRDGDIHVRSRDGGQEFALTDDAEPHVDYGTLTEALGNRVLMRNLGLPQHLIVEWSPDSTRLLVHRLDQRDLPEQVLVESAPADGGRPVEHRSRYPMPGDEAQATMSWNVLQVTGADAGPGGIVRQQGEPYVVLHPGAMTYRWWSGEKGETIHYLQQSRDARTLELRRMDPSTGETTTLISETGSTRVDPGAQLGDPTMTRVLDSGEILWWSQRDGWGHLYLYSADGEEVTQLTRGRWPVRSLLWVDEERRQVWFLASGLVEDDPYVRQICRVGLDGTGFTRITDDELDHDAVSPPQGGYLVDRASSPSTPPRSAVLGGDGQVLVELESPGTDGLTALGWTPPERFTALAADGRTPVYGLLWRPHDVDPSRSYPVIDHIYPGPQVHRAGASFDVPHHGEPEALAALGFAVVAVDGRGTAGRSKAFHDHSYGALGDAGSLVDHIAAIRELGHRHPWLDTARVGITGHSGGGFATARALLAHPEFYSVGVATAGNHDMGVYVPMWAEWYHGEMDDEARTALSNPALAENLQGKLLLIHGELDDNVLPSQTMRLVDALVSADKDVDMLIVPGAEHAMIGRMHYVLRRTWDYLVRHLHGTEPPRYRLAPLPLDTGGA